MYYSQLRAFHAVAAHGGFSKAAQKVHLTQPAISDHVRKLEERFDVLLFNRQKRSVVPTDLGRKLFVITRRMFEMEQEAIELLAESQALRTGLLRIAADAPFHLASLIGKFRKAYPGISISLRMGNSDETLGRLFEYEADIAVLAYVPDDDRLRHITLRNDPLVAFVSSEHPWANNKKISLKKLCGEPLVMRERGSTTRAIIEKEFARLGLSYTVAMEADRREAVREAVASGIGVGIVSQSEFGFDNRLKALKLTDTQATMTESLVCLAERFRLRTVAAFWDIAKRGQIDQIVDSATV
ncbi:MAG: LysR substrate-binding domain-containing protein [Methyloligellaceae bacterium]